MTKNVSGTFVNGTCGYGVAVVGFIEEENKVKLVFIRDPVFFVGVKGELCCQLFGTSEDGLIEGEQVELVEKKPDGRSVGNRFFYIFRFIRKDEVRNEKIRKFMKK